MNTLRADSRIPVNSLLPFLVVAFGLAWGIVALYLAMPETMAASVGELSGSHPLFLLAIYAPSIAAIGVVAVRSGKQGLRGFFGRLTLWRCSRAWVVFMVGVVPLIYWVGGAISGKGVAELLPHEPAAALLKAILFAGIMGPMEEFGWRGLALPLLQRKLRPFWAGIVLGLIWGVWHLPAFALEGTPQSGWSFLPFFVGAVAVSVIATALFNASRGSILLAALFHWQLINPMWPDVQPYDIGLFVLAAAVVTWLNRTAMFERDGAVTGVLG